MSDNPFHKAGRIFFTLCGIVFFVLLVYKAVHMGITYDEAYSFLHHASSSFGDILLYKGTLPANNHIINTLSMKLFSGVFGVSEFTLRIGSLVGALLYIFGVYRLTRHFGEKKVLLRYVAPIIFFANPYVFDFLVAARGYSLALGCMMMGFSFFLPVLGQKHSTKDVHAFMLFFLFMTIASLPFLNVYLAVCGVYFLFILIAKKRSRKRFGIVSLYTLVLGGLYIIPIRSMQAQDDLRFGGASSIFSDTYLSLIRSFLYENTSNEVQMILIILCASIVLLATWYAVRFFVAQKKQHSRSAAMTTVFLLVSLSIVAQHILLGTPYVVDRTALYFFPLMGLIIFTLVETVPRRIYSIILLGCGAMLTHFIFSYNLSYIPFRQSDMPIKNILLDLEKQSSQEQKTITLGIERFNEPPVEFYLLKEKIDNINHFIVGNTAEIGDIYYVRYETYERFRISNRDSRLLILKNYPETNMVLFTLN